MATVLLGQKIRKVREARGLSQTTVAKLLDMGQQGYSCYETNVVTMPLPKFFKLCDIFGMTPDELMAVEVEEDSEHVTA